MTIYIITGDHDTIAQLRAIGMGEFVMVDIDVSDLPDPATVMGDLTGDDPRVFPAMMAVGGDEVARNATQACAVARQVAYDNPSDDVTVLVRDEQGRVQAPAVGGVVAAFLRSVGYEVGITHTGLSELLV